MGEKDLATKTLEAYNDVFADIFNTLLFESDELIPQQLKAGPTESVYKAAEKKRGEKEGLREQRRDTLKEYQDSERYVIMTYGIENQIGADDVMPVRVMGYDYGTYRQQVIEEKYPLHPVVTIVLNFSNDCWTKKKSLYEMMEVSEKQKRYVQDYRITVFDVAYLDDGIIDRFQSDFKHVARFFKYRRLNNLDALTSNLLDIKHAEPFVELLSVFTGDSRYEELIPGIRKQLAEGGMISMCWIIESQRKLGIEQGMELDAKMLFKNGASMELVSASITRLTKERLQELQKEAYAEIESDSRPECS